MFALQHAVVLPFLDRRESEMNMNNVDAGGLMYGDNTRDGETHREWHWDCDKEGNGCALHAFDASTDTFDPHVHRCTLHEVSARDERQKPILAFSQMTDRVYVLTEYVDHGGGKMEAIEKLDITDEFKRLAAELKERT